MKLPFVMPKYPARYIVHTPSRQVHLCEEHMKQKVLWCMAMNWKPKLQVTNGETVCERCQEIHQPEKAGRKYVGLSTHR